HVVYGGSTKGPLKEHNRRQAGHPPQPSTRDVAVSSRMKTGNGRAPAPLGAARLAGDNRAKQNENRKRVQPGLAARARLGVFVGFANLSSPPAPQPAPLPPRP